MKVATKGDFGRGQSNHNGVLQQVIVMEGQYHASASTYLYHANKNYFPFSQSTCHASASSGIFSHLLTIYHEQYDYAYRIYWWMQDASGR